MEWDLEMPPWDLPELEANAAAANLSSVAASSGSSSGQKPGGMDCSVDLKLGGLGDFGLADKWKEHSRASALPPAAASLAKRPRMPGGGSQNVSCLVDGCRSDLSNCREYHRRHKVCEVHSKTPIVLVGGQEQRFCQQCSRFHLLAEFDEVKRSCRKRLDGHNRRRRKPQIEPINPGNLYPSPHGTGFTSYPQTFPASTDTTWISIGAGAEDTRYGHSPLSMHFLDRVQPFSGSLSIKEGKQFPFLHSSEGMATGCRTAVEQTAVCQPLLKPFSPAESSGSKTMFSEGLPPVFSSDCALSLLSSSTRTAGINLGSMVTVERIPIGQPLLPSLQYGAELGRFARTQGALGNIGVSTVGMDNPPVGSVVISDGSDAELHYHGMYPVGNEAPSDGPSQPTTFTWQYSRHL